MARKKSPITDYAFEEEEEEAGRPLGAVAKRNRDVYEQFKREAALRGLKTSEAVEEALKLWTLSKNIQNIDPDALVAAINFVNYMREVSIKELLALGKLFTSEFFRVQMGIAQEIAAQAQPQKEETTKQPSPDEMVKQQMKLQIMNTIIPLYLQVVQQLLNALNPSVANMPIALPAQTQTTQKRKVIVEE